MASESNPPPAPGGGLKYGILGLLLLAAAVGIWFAMRDGEPEKAPRAEAPAEPERPKRSTSLAREDFVIPEEEQDAGAAREEPEEERPRRRARRRAPTCDGEIDPAAVRSFIQQQRPQVRACYERRLKVNNVLQGRVDVRVRVDASGNVQSAEVGGTMGDQEVYRCVQRLAQQWKLPALSEGRCAVINVPFNLAPRP
ncbi:MAG: AgmX/PglI C-terminal domain-containing protein [Myxococcota bacterium]